MDKNVAALFQNRPAEWVEISFVLAWNYTSVNTLLGNLLEQASMSKHGEDENSIDALECEIVSQVINNYFYKL